MRRAIAATGLLFTLVACQTIQTVSLEDAKQITATFQGRSITPPPKTIRDITAILDEQVVADPEEIQSMKVLADSQPRDGATATELAKYFLDRGRAAIALGRSDQWLRDYRKAASLLGDAWSLHIDTITHIRNAVAIAEQSFGHIRNAEKQLFTRLNKKDSMGTMRHLVRLYTEIGELDAAEKIRDRALIRSNIDATRRSTSIALVNHTLHYIEGMMHAARGEWRAAEQSIRISLETGKLHSRYYGYPYWDNSTVLERYLTTSLIRQGRYLEAEIFAREALTKVLEGLGKVSLYTPYVLTTLAQTLDAQGRYAEAESLLRTSIKIYAALDHPPQAISVATARFQLGATMVSLLKWDEAVAEFERVEDSLTEESRVMYDLWVKQGIDVPLALVMAGKANAAHSLISELYETSVATLGEKHALTAEKGAVLAMASAAIGDREGAFENFKNAVPILLSSSRQSDSEISSEAAKSTRINILLGGYINLLSDVAGTELERRLAIDVAAEAFRIADVVRSRSVQTALAASGARAAAGDGDLAELVRREQDARKQISAMYGLLGNALSLSTDQQNPASILSLRTRIDSLRGARAALAEEIEQRFPEYAELINPKPATIAKVQASLRPGESLIATYVADAKTYVWAVPKSGKASFAIVKLGKKQIAAAVQDLRAALDPQATTLCEIPPFNVNLSYRLYRALLEPVKDGWMTANSLLIVPHRALGQLPFSTLVTARVALPDEKGTLFSNYKMIPWLARTHQVTVLPSVTSLASLRALPPANPARRSFAGFGDPYFNARQAADAAGPKPIQTASIASSDASAFGDITLSLRAAPKTRNLASANLSMPPRLPDTFDEVRSIAAVLNADMDEDVFTGERASENNVKTTNLSDYKVIAFATHGLIPGELDGLRQPALALSSPQLSGNSEEDGLLTMGEILGLRLDADWVVLSACNTGAGDGVGAEAFSGLGRAFFYAGTRSILLSNWPVETNSARLLTTDLFRRQAENPAISRAEALRQSMLTMIDGKGFADTTSGKVAFSYAHPIFWAPFSLVGDGGGGQPAS